MRWQVTLFDKSNKHKPVSCIVSATEKMEAVNKGVVKICQKRYWTNKDRVREGYTIAKARKVEE